VAEFPAVDARGLNCPQPVLRLRRALVGMERGDEVELMATDRLSNVDVDVFCFRYKHTLVSKSDVNGVLTFRVRKGGRT